MGTSVCLQIRRISRPRAGHGDHLWGDWRGNDGNGDDSNGDGDVDGDG